MQVARDRLESGDCRPGEEEGIGWPRLRGSSGCVQVKADCGTSNPSLSHCPLGSSSLASSPSWPPSPASRAPELQVQVSKVRPSPGPGCFSTPLPRDTLDSGWMPTPTDQRKQMMSELPVPQLSPSRVTWGPERGGVWVVQFNLGNDIRTRERSSGHFRKVVLFVCGGDVFIISLTVQIGVALTTE